MSKDFSSNFFANLSAWIQPLALAFVLLTAGEGLAADWNTKVFQEESTLEFLTVGPDEGEHWSIVWMVVIDGQVYLNLGDRAVQRLRANTSAPFVSVRIDGKRFDRILSEPAQERQKEVAAAIADKYWTGFLVPYRPPSTIMRLRPE